MSDQITVEFDVPATMRDGTLLRANIFRPADEGSYPVLLTRTPYGKDFFSAPAILDAVRMARAGYMVVIQDVRGRFRSDGEWAAFRHEAHDGYDSVEWAARLPHSNGNVGMYGLSYLGFTQWMAAAQTPPHLKAIMPSLTWADVRDGVVWRGAALELGLMAYWQLNAIALDVVLKRHQDSPIGERVKALGALIGEIDRLRSEGYRSLPLKDFEPLMKLDIAPDFIEELISHPYSPERSAPFSVYESYDRVKVPAYNIGGWYDIFCQGTLQNFTSLRSAGRTPEARQAKLLIGPWSHVSYTNVVGEMDFGYTSAMAFINAQFDLTALTQRWFDYWLKGIDNGILKEPPIKLFVMGDNLWRDEHEWPLARTQYTPFYVHRHGALSTQLPDDEPADHYRYDPANPTPTYGGALLMNALYGPGVRDQRSIETRDDVLVYTSEPLARDTEVSGPVIVKLWACSDAPDTDFVARLIDVQPDGFAQNLTDGIIRARYRNGDTPEWLESGKAYEFSINLWSTANVFKAGHRIRLDIASASFPRWDRNPNTGEPFGMSASLRLAQQTILHDAAHPSHVVLPLIPR